MVIQHAGTTYKVSTDSLKTYFQNGVNIGAATATTLGTVKPGANLTVQADGTLDASLPGALVYKGTCDLTSAPTGADQTAPQIGFTFINTAVGTSTGWAPGIPDGTTVAKGEMVLWDGSKWDIIGLEPGVAGGVQTVTGTLPVEVGGTATDPVVSVKDAVAQGQTGATSGLISAVNQQKLDGIASGAQIGTVTNISATTPLHVANPTSTPTLTVDDASTTAKGVVRLADAAAVTAGTAGRVVTADQLKTTNDAISAAAGGGITGIAGTAPITITGPNTAKVVAIADATSTVKGAVELATSPETAFDVGSPSSVLAVTPAGLKVNYMPLDINKLTQLP